MKNRKLQVFVSSTYKDLKEERQAAVQAILTAGHIPAGMELFTAGDETQMDVIKEWINESDIFLLILGGRYGSIESETKRSYTHLEYEHAVSQNKPFFAVVIENKHLDALASDKKEQENPGKLKDFRDTVLTKMVGMWNNPDKMENEILKALMKFSKDESLVGWVPGNKNVDTGPIAEEIARLSNENDRLRDELSAMKSNPERYNGLTYLEVYEQLEKISMRLPESHKQFVDFISESEKTIEYLLENDELTSVDQTLMQMQNLLQQTANACNDELPNLMHLLGVVRYTPWILNTCLFIEQSKELEFIGLLNSSSEFTDSGRKFLNRLSMMAPERIREYANEFSRIDDGFTQIHEANKTVIGRLTSTLFSDVDPI